MVANAISKAEWPEDWLQLDILSLSPSRPFVENDARAERVEPYHEIPLIDHLHHFLVAVVQVRRQLKEMGVKG